MVKKTPPQKKDNSTKSQKIYDNLSKVIQQFMTGKRYEPMGPTDLLKRLKIPSVLHSLCKQIITDLLEQGIIELHKKQLFPKKAELDVITGTLRMHPRGFGFVIPDHPAQCPQDVFIPKHLTDSAVDGDKVEIAINPDSNSDKGPEGKIISILKRGRTHLAGTVRLIDSLGNIVVHVPLLGASKPVIVRPSDGAPLKIGDRIIMKVLQWSDEEKGTLCEMSHYIGNINDASKDIPAAIEEFDLNDSFPKPAILQAKKYGKSVTKKDQKGRVDLTKDKSITIDPETAKDFDDALSIKKDRKGNYRLGVHIADVAHYVPQFSPLDMEASERCNSTYFPGACVPMLPEELSNQLCSLRPDVIRLTASVLMEFDKEGTLQNYEVVRSFIKSAKRFSYEEAKLVLDGKKKSPHLKELKLMVELCHLLKKKRSERGSIDFSLPDLVIEVDPKGVPSKMRFVEYDITHQLVEEFMLKANELVAKYLSDQGKPVMFRIHEEPSPENFQDFFALARSLGFPLPEKPAHKDIQTLFDQAKSTPFGQQLSVGFIRSMKLAMYSPDNVGHYGLALEYYCHFTSPIRRYSDLVTQRILFDQQDLNANFEEIALRCSDQERVSFRAETSVKVLKKLRLLHHYLKEDSAKIYPAVVTKIKPFGLFFEITGLMLEGFLHISELEDDFFLFEARRNALVGKSSGRVHSVGEEIKVIACSVDFILLESTWMLSSDSKRRSFRRRR